MSDHRTKDWFLVDNPLPLIAILTCYLIFCTKVGPQFMKNRKPFKLTNILLVYNVIQVVVSVIILYEGLMGGWLFDYNYKCQPVDYSENPTARRMAKAVWYYYMCKLIELSDTVFFVLRKKDNQVSFLHLYHHTMMPICSWVGVKWLPGGHGTLLGIVQFVIIIIHSSLLFVYDCNYPKTMIALLGVNTIFIMMLFMAFYCLSTQVEKYSLHIIYSK
ncbi:elongation of very long chain fatty acids protein, putative [Pediculus humanus corporis]|uniref:Elongation of very long chain fatty acids protein n=1 Tax=Pediculus humanus subsp. corporis TaxID=121224 RepID=E0VQR2_PEDHC|nr:elongation of very long chain fatty acids protein, putative [Pediculus humanus corporis]EEB15717.1 elongation of very long chain fatty acids protein, putative [Pediculus humanus corporis]